MYCGRGESTRGVREGDAGGIGEFSDRLMIG
jgi:hypothetical protein